MIQPSTVIRRNPRVEFRHLADGEGGVLLHLDTAAYHGINETGAFIWGLVDGITFEELLARLRDQMENVPSTFEDEVARVVRELADRDLLLLSSGNAS